MRWLTSASADCLRILYTRNCFGEDNFENRHINGLHCKSLGGPHCDDKGKHIIDWIEKGIFDAIAKGYLERVVLCLSEDPEAESMIEAWHLGIQWVVDDEGIEHPTFKMGLEDGAQASVAIVSQKKYTLSYVQSTTQTALRQLISMLQTLPRLPDSHYISKIGRASCRERV